jgi:hypothetical protein
VKVGARGRGKRLTKGGQPYPRQLCRDAVPTLPGATVSRPRMTGPVIPTCAVDGVRHVQNAERSLTPSWGIPGVEERGEIGSVEW